MSVLAKRISDDSLFEFTCTQWALMSDLSKADWEAQQNTCSGRKNEGNPYASSDQIFTFQGTVGAAAPITLTLIDGVYTVGLAYGTGLSVVDGVLVNSAPDQVVALTAGANVTITGTYPNFTIASSGISDGDKGDITVSGATWTIDAQAVTNSKLRDSAALSVIGRSANTTGSPADIAATVDGQVLRRSGTTLGFGTVATAGIADQAVTYAKIQNVVNNNRVLGRISGAGGVVEELSITNLYTLLGLAGTANRFAIWTGANNLNSDPSFTFTQSPPRMTVEGNAAGSGANQAFLNLNSSAITGATEFLRMSGNINGNMLATMFNANNANANNHAIFQIVSGGGAAGDAAMQFTVNGVMSHAIGIDNSDGDRLKLTPNAATPGATANMGVIIRDNGGTGNTGVNIDFPTHPLTIKGRARGELYMGEGNIWAAGNLSFGNGAGTGPTLTTIIGTNNCVEVFFTTGTAPTANGNIFTLTYPLAYITRSFVTFSAGGHNSAAAGDNAANEFLKFKINLQGAGSFTFKAVGTLPASTSFAITFQIFGY